MKRIFKTILSLAMATTALTACTEENEEMYLQGGTPLQLTINAQTPQTKAIVEGNILPANAEIGVCLVDDSGTKYDGKEYFNVKYTTTDGHIWQSDTPIMLTGKKGTLYAYYPYSEDLQKDGSSIKLNISAGDTDYMSATPVTEVSDKKPKADITLSHALAAIRLKLTKGSYIGKGQISNIKVLGEGFDDEGVLTIHNQWIIISDDDEYSIEKDVDIILSDTEQGVDFLVLPNATKTEELKIIVTMDGNEYTVTTDAVTLKCGYSYIYTIEVNSEAMLINDVKVDEWGYSENDDMVIYAGHKISLTGDMENIAIHNKVNDDGSVTITAVPVKQNGGYVKKVTHSGGTPTVSQNVNMNIGSLQIDIANIDEDITVTFDGVSNVYAVTAENELVITEDADESCIAVALIVNDAPTPQRLMIEKNETNNTTSIKAAYEADGATNTGYQTFYWGMRGQDVSGITNYSNNGYLPKPDGTYQSTPNLSSDYTTWTSGCLSDFSGKANTAALMEVEDTDSYTAYANMATWCKIFNETPSENQGFNDWYIPSMGQLALIYLNKTAINEALTKIGGLTFASLNYWSSSESSSNYGFRVGFNSGGVHINFKNSSSRVRVVRDI